MNELAECQAIVRLLRAEEGVLDADVRTDPGTGELVAYVAVAPALADEVQGFPRRIVGDGLAIAELHRNETDFLYNRIFTRQVYLSAGLDLPRAAVVIDAGANIGLFSLYASRLTGGARVYAVEPDPRAAAVLRANFAAHGLAGMVIEAALAQHAGHATFTRYPDFSLLSGLYTDPDTDRSMVRTFVTNQAGEVPDGPLAPQLESLLAAKFGTQRLEVVTKRLSDIIADHQIGQIDLLKVNVEKSELAVLRGVSDADWERISQVVVEVDTASHLAPIVELLTRAGMETRIEQDEPLRGTELHFVYGARRGFAPPGGTAAASAPHRQEPLPWPKLLGEVLPGRVAGWLTTGPRPTRIVIADSLPRNADGTLDVTRLSGRSRPVPTASVDKELQPWSPASPTETALARAWQETLGIPPQSPDDDFIGAGGDSLLAVDLCVLLEQRMGVSLEIADVLDNSSFAGLATLVTDGAE